MSTKPATQAVRFTTLLLVAFFAACNVEVPDQDVAPTPAGSAPAAEYLQRLWIAALDLPGDNYTIPPITWYKGKCLTWTYLPEPHDCTTGMYFSGEAWTGERIEILLPAHSLAESSLPHELLHWALQRRDGDCDDGHHGPEWHGLLQDMELEFCTFEGVRCEVDP